MLILKIDFDFFVEQQQAVGGAHFPFLLDPTAVE
jgi:hypothetical protein